MNIQDLSTRQRGVSRIILCGDALYFLPQKLIIFLVIVLNRQATLLN